VETREEIWRWFSFGRRRRRRRRRVSTVTRKKGPSETVGVSRERARKIEHVSEPGIRGRRILGPRGVRTSDRPFRLQTVETV